MLSKQAIKEFRKIYEAKLQKELSYAEATERAEKLFALYRAVYEDKTSGLIKRNNIQKNANI